MLGELQHKTFDDAAGNSSSSWSSCSRLAALPWQLNHQVDHQAKHQEQSPHWMMDHQIPCRPIECDMTETSICIFQKFNRICMVLYCVKNSIVFEMTVGRRHLSAAKSHVVFDHRKQQCQLGRQERPSHLVLACSLAWFGSTTLFSTRLTAWAERCGRTFDAAEVDRTLQQQRSLLRLVSTVFRAYVGHLYRWEALMLILS